MGRPETSSADGPPRYSHRIFSRVRPPSADLLLVCLTLIAVNLACGCYLRCYFRGGDTDHDGVCDDVDNCYSASNHDQADFDGDGKGDACDYDADNDGYSRLNLSERGSPRPGYDCDDFDPDVSPGTPEACDGKDNNCNGVPDDGLGDDDSDGWGAACDNCPDDYNPLQEDDDGDEAGDACDGCPADPDKTDSGVCGCGVPDTDSDGDLAPDCNDACPNEPALTEPQGPTEAECADSIDNDCDGWTDDADNDCALPVCTCGDIDTSGGSVDLGDFATFAACFGLAAPYPPYCTVADLVCSDLDGNGIVDLDDFATFAAWFGQQTLRYPPDCERLPGTDRMP